MKKISTLGLLLAASTTLGLLSVRCGTAAPDPVIPPRATGGTATGGTATGGVVETGGTATGGISTGGIATGGVVDTGGTATGGTTGGTATGGTTGGTATGGASGGSGASGGGNGGASGAATGGAGGASAGQGGGGGGGVSGGAGGGDAGGGGAGGTGPVTFTQVAMILDTHCSVCHAGGAAQPLKISLRNDATLYMRLTTALTSTVAAKCNTRVLVDKTTPTNSLLSQVLKPGGVSDTANNCTIPQMPKDSVLNPTDIATINSWINAGAPQ